MCSMDAPERLYGHVFGGCLVAHDLHDPAIDGALVKAKERFESVYVAPLELIEDVALSVPHRVPLSIYCYSPCSRKVTCAGRNGPQTPREGAVGDEPSAPRNKAIFQKEMVGLVGS